MSAPAKLTLNPKQRKIVKLVTEQGLSQAEAAKELSISHSYVSKIMARQDVQEHILAEARMSLGSLAPSAVNTLAKLTRNAKSEFVQLQAATAILDRVGLSEPDTSATLAIQINLD